MVKLIWTDQAIDDLGKISKGRRDISFEILLRQDYNQSENSFSEH